MLGKYEKLVYLISNQGNYYTFKSILGFTIQQIAIFKKKKVQEFHTIDEGMENNDDLHIQGGL